MQPYTPYSLTPVLLTLLSRVRRALRLGAETERTSAPERPPSRVPLLIFFSLIFSKFLVVSIASRWTQQLQVATQDEYELRVPITILSALTTPLLYITFHFSLSYTSGLAL